MPALRTLVITETLPYPALGGMDIRNWQNINCLMNLGQVGVFGLKSNDLGECETPSSSLSFWKSSDFWQTKQELSARAWLLEPTGHPSDMYYSQALVSEIVSLLNDFKPQVVVIEGLCLHRYIDILRRHNCRIILDSHNVEAAVVREIANSTLGDDLPARMIRNVLPERTKTIEKKAADVVNQVWVCSKDDARLMYELYRPSTPIRVVPNAVNVDYYEEVRARKYMIPEAVHPNGRTLIFPASFRWEPNAKAAVFLTEEVFPRLAKIYQDCYLVLVGRDPTPHMTTAAKRNYRIVVTGQIPDVRPYLSAATAMVVPLFQGGGTRLKILEAFASNIPVISTAKGAEGLDVEDGIHLLIAESAEEFVHAAQRIWTDERLTKQLTANGLELVKRHYSWGAVSHQIAKAIHELNMCE